MITLTDFGDLAVLIPLSALILLWLLAMRSTNAAVWWLAAVILCAGGTALLKIYFGACPAGRELTNPSGHTSFSTLVFGTLAFVVAAERGEGWQRIAVIGITALFVIAIAASRLVLAVHSSVEVVLGAIIGLVALAVFAHGYRRHRPVRVSLTPLFLAVVVLTALFHGRELRAEQFLHAIGHYFGVASLFCG
jgi:membrane-associated phospholipid phosphatase